MSSWHSYPSIFNLGHRAIADLFSVPVIVEEKVDGSQFSFGLIEELPAQDPAYSFGITNPGLPQTYELRVRSKGAVMHPDAPEKMFNHGVNAVKQILPLLHPGWTYRGEYLAKPNHNALAYDRVPTGHIVLFDINTDDETYLSPAEKAEEAQRLGFECVPVLYSGQIPGISPAEKIQYFRSFLDTTSMLGGQKIEGVVIKPLNYNLYGPDKKCLFGKFVSEAFREVHKRSWKETNPTNGDIIQQIGADYCTAARWNKAIQHLRDAGKLMEDVKDIGNIIREVPADVFAECEQEMKDRLWKHAKPHITRQLTRGLPEFYKDRLLRLQFEREEPTVETEL
jgi:hypothetical protein